MALNVYTDKDANPALLAGKKVAVIGYGSQGHAHALNLRDSKVDVAVGLRRSSPSWAKAEGAGLKVLDTAEAAAWSDIAMMLVPDEMGSEIYEAEVKSGLRKGKATASTSTSRRSCRPPTSTSSWSPPRAPATWSAASMRTGAVSRA